MEENVQFALSVYGFAIWGWAALLGALAWWSSRPLKKGAPRVAVARAAFLLSLSSITLMPVLFPLEWHLGLLFVLLFCSFLLWWRKEAWPLYLFLLSGSVVFANDGAVLLSFIQTDGLFGDFLAILTFQSEPSLDSFFDIFVGPLVYGSIVALCFRLIFFLLGAWAVTMVLQRGRKR